MHLFNSAILIVLLAPYVTCAATLTVDKSDCDGDVYCDIQTAIDAAVADDTVSIAAGDYNLWQQSIRIKKSLTLEGAGATVTRLMGDGNAPESLMVVEEGVASVILRGLALQDRVVSGSPVMGPGGLDHRGDNLHLSDVAFVNNSGGWGGAVRIQTLFGEVQIDNCIFDGNTGFAGGGLAVYSGTALELSIKDSVFKNNNAVFSGGALLMRDIAEVSLNNILVENNSAGNTGGGAHFFTDTSSSQVVVADSTFTGNQASKAGGVSSFGGDVSVVIKGSALQNNKSFDNPERADCDGVGFDLQHDNTIGQKTPCSN